MDVEPHVINSLDQLVQQRFNLEAELHKFQAAYTESIKVVTDQIADIDAAIWQLVQSNRPALISPGKQSFATASATFQFRAIKPKVVPTDPDGIMATARKFGVVSQIATPPERKWKFSKQRFLAWLDSHANLARYFQQFIELSGPSESLSAKPNTGHPVFHDKERLTPLAFTIKKS